VNQKNFLQNFKLLNTAVVSGNTVEGKSFSGRLEKLMNHSAFRALFKAVDSYSVERGISKEKAMKEVVLVMKDLNELWSDYIFAQGSIKLNEMIDNDNEVEKSKLPNVSRKLNSDEPQVTRGFGF